MPDRANIVGSYRTRGVLVDSNLLLLLFIGIYDQSRISRFKRTQQYSAADFSLLLEFLNLFDKRITTPNILTEVSNLANNMDATLHFGFYTIFEKLLGQFIEIATPSTEVAAHDLFKIFGLSDASILSTARDRYLVVTDDDRLAAALSIAGVDSLNFTVVRALAQS